jgi:hypothetical protein
MLERNAMTDLPLPAQSFEEAIPYLRAPYQPSQVRAKILTTPENPSAPCTIALYVIGEIQMDRFTLVCGSEWDHEFTKLAEEKRVAEKRRCASKESWYCMVAATFTAFGIAHTDIGEGVARTRAVAEMNARAQASKRAGRKFGPGQCLYACDTILMYRGDKPNQLRLPVGDDPKRHLKPYFDKEGQGEKYCRERYANWLRDTGEKIYGPPLDHCAVAEAIRARPSTRRATSTSSRPERADAPAPSRNGTGTDHESLTTSETPTSPDAPPAAKEHPPMPDHPAPEAVLKAAQAADFGEPVARLLSNLAREEGKDATFTAAQLQAATHWITTLADLEVAEELIVKAITFNATKNISQERRQAKFVKWLSEKAAGETEPAPDQPSADTASGSTGSAPAANGDRQLDAARALTVLRQAKEEHEYSDRTVTRLAALATGAGPNARVDWPSVPAATLLILTELLQSAGALGWKNDHLDREIRAGHNSSEQTSTAGRFTAFANYLTDLAETRAMTQAEPIELT